jgi:hypothetical protein
MKITRLPRGNAQFPEEKEPGDIVVLYNGDIFTWCRDIWFLIGGRYLKEESREWLIDYLKDRWPSPREAGFDLPQFAKLNGSEKEDIKWSNMAISNVLKYAEMLYSRDGE